MPRRENVCCEETNNNNSREPKQIERDVESDRIKKEERIEIQIEELPRKKIALRGCNFAAEIKKDN